MNTNELLTLSQAARLCPGRPGAATLWRWARKGVRGRDGSTIRLKHARFGRRIFVTAEALAEFGRAIADADAEAFDAPAPAREAPPKAPTAKARELEIQRAEAALIDAGA